MAIATLLVSACASPVAAPSLSANATAPALVIEPQAAARYDLLAVTRRWRPSDVFQYTVRLTRWNGMAFVDLPTPVVVVLPQKGAVRTQARFTNLSQGRRYRATVTAWGNAGGTAPAQVLNAGTPSVAEIDYRGAQDVQDTLLRQVSITLDPVSFSGTAVVNPLNVPPGTQNYDLELSTGSGAVVYSTSFARMRMMTLSNLKAGVPYTVTLTARRANGTVQAQASAAWSWDPKAPELEQDLTVPVTF